MSASLSKSRHLFLPALVLLASFPGLHLRAQDDSGDFRVSDPIVCKTVEGLRNYVRRDPPELTTYDKLVVYLEPAGFETHTVDGKRRASFVQNGKVRATGSKKVIFERAELSKFEPEVFGPGATFYLAATVGFKNLPVGDYVLELETVDVAAEPDRKIIRSVPFRIIAAETDDAGTDRPKADRPKAKPARKPRNGNG